jgi:predicted porin
MKKNVIALAIASAIAAPVAMADAPTVYGKVNVAIDSLSGGDNADEGMRTTDRDSRIGVKGSEDLGNGLKAVYKMEFGVKVGDAFTTKINDGDKAASGFSGRNAYIGLAGGFGTVLMGRHDSPLKMSQPKDLFGDSTYADIGKDTMTGNLGILGKGGENRFNDVVAYVSPAFAGITFAAAGVSTEDGTAIDGSDSSVTDAYSVAVMYGSKKEGLYLAAAMDQTDEEDFGADWTHVRVSAQYAAGGLIANLIYQDFDADNIDDAKEGSNIQVSAGYKMGKLMPKVKYSTTDFDADGADDVSAYGVGLNYALGKKTTGYIEYVSSDEDMNGGDDLNAFSVGLLHKF